MKILIFSLNYAPEPTGIGLYSGGLAQSLADLGHDVHVVCAVPHFPQWKLFDGFRNRWATVKARGVTVTRCPVYIPEAPSGARRIAHYLTFAATALPVLVKRTVRFRPDIVLCVAPSLIAAPVGLMAARLCKAKAQLHVQDFEVEAAFATDNMSGSGALARMARGFERTVMRAFDAVSTISPEMARKLTEKGVAPERVLELRNWAEIDDIRPQPDSAYRHKWGIASRHVALYSGSIAQKQGIESLIDAARALAHREDITFVICGNGPRRTVLEDYAQGLSNVQFHDLQPMADLGELLNLASVHLLPQRKDAADLVLPSKMANMLASGRPVVAGVEPGTGIAREIDGCGLICEPEDGPAMAAAIEDLLGEPDRYDRFCQEARTRATQRWSRTAIIEDFVRAFQKHAPTINSEDGAPSPVLQGDAGL